MSAVKLPAIFSGIRSRKDKTFSLTFDTQELTGKDASALLDLQQSFCALLIAPQASDLDDVEIPDYRPLEGQTKTPSQRLRAVMFVFFEQQGGSTVFGLTFDAWYAGRIESLISQYKEKLEEMGA